MRVILFLLSCVPFLFGVMIMLESATSSNGLASAVSLNLAVNMFLIWAVLFTGAAIVDSIVNGAKKIVEEAFYLHQMDTQNDTRERSDENSSKEPPPPTAFPVT